MSFQNFFAAAMLAVLGTTLNRVTAQPPPYQPPPYQPPPHPEYHVPYQTNYVHKNYNYHPQPYFPNNPPPPGLTPMTPPPDVSTTTKTTTMKEPGYRPPSLKPILSVTYSVPTLPPVEHTEKVIQGLPHEKKPEMKVNLIGYDSHRYPMYTTQYTTTTTPKYDPNSSYGTPTTTVYTTTATYERPPSPEYHIQVQPTYNEEHPTPPPQPPVNTPKSILTPAPASSITASTTTTTTTTPRPYAPPMFKPMLSAEYKPDPLKLSDHEEKVQQGMPHLKKDSYDVGMLGNYQHAYPMYTTLYPVTQTTTTTTTMTTTKTTSTTTTTSSYRPPPSPPPPPGIPYSNQQQQQQIHP